jgi:hypothetical protein
MRAVVVRPFVCLTFALLFAACSDDPANSISLTSGGVIELFPVTNQKKNLEFEASDSWTASCPAAWLSFTPKSGGTGAQSITLTTTSTNRTKATRSAQLTITAGSARKNVTVVQSGKYAVFDQKEYIVEAAGGSITLGFTSNCVSGTDNLQIGYNPLDWIGWANGSAVTRADRIGRTPEIFVQPNTSGEGRRTAFCLLLSNGEGGWMNMDTTFVYQRGVTKDYESTDYTADGEVHVLQQSTKGVGIPIVLMGDGFADKDIADSTYHRVMTKALANLFSEEPAKSLREFFDVYSVVAVSKHGAVGSNYTTTFSCVPRISDTSIDCDEQQVETYARKVSSIDYESMLTVVIANTDSHHGVTYLYYDRYGKPRQHAISLCPVIDSLESETFRQVLVHEAIGHGFAKLGDEYGYEHNTAIGQREANNLKVLHTYNWMLNVDTADQPASVIWSPFVGDERFANENIGVYEGGYTYMTGVYRPTEESMMRSNQSPFNAPSRKAIYDRVMRMGVGRTGISLDEFAAFDIEHKPAQWSYSATRGLSPWQSRHFAPPVLKTFETKPQ